jgi:hypothetical protein
VRGQPPELQQVVLLQSRSQLEVVKVVKVIDRIPQGLVILLLDQQIVVSVVDSFNIVVLHRDEVFFDKGNVVVVLPLEHANDTSVIDTRAERGQEIGKESGLLLKVEGEGLEGDQGLSGLTRGKIITGTTYFVVNLNVGNLDDDLLELVVVPCIC